MKFKKIAFWVVVAAAAFHAAYVFVHLSFVLPVEGEELAVVNSDGTVLGQAGGREDRVGEL